MHPTYTGTATASTRDIPDTWLRPADPGGPEMHVMYELGWDAGARTGKPTTLCPPESVRVEWLYMKLEDGTEYGEWWREYP